MKNVLFLITSVLLLLTTDCKKEEDPLLSEFIIGDWVSQNREINFDENSNYSLTITGTQPSTCNATSYIVNDKENTITISVPFCSSPSNLIIIADTYDVLWSADKNNMSWTSHGGGGEPTVIWTKQ